MKTYHDLPAPTPDAQIRSDALMEVIRQKIQQHNGRIGFSEFMDLALYHPQYGYYKSTTFDLGKQGDFTTAPEISPLFAKCVANQCREIFSTLDERTIYELGAGTGRLALDILVELEKLNILPKNYYIYEISPKLREKQLALLTKARPDLVQIVTWLDELPKQLSGIVIANEVLDALPCDCFEVNSGNTKERFVSIEAQGLAWKTHTPHPLLKQEADKLIAEYSLANGYQSEINLQAAAYLANLCDSLTKGVMLLIDYGYGQREYYHPQRVHGTLSCFYQHQLHDNPFIYPGLQDMTAHVDFTRMIETAADHDCQLVGFTTQTAFLLGNGLLDYAEQEEQGLSEKDAFSLHQAIKTLTMPTEMGDLVKVMAISKGWETQPLAGFKMLDRRRDL